MHYALTTHTHPHYDIVNDLYELALSVHATCLPARVAGVRDTTICVHAWSCKLFTSSCQGWNTSQVCAYTPYDIDSIEAARRPEIMYLQILLLEEQRLHDL